MTQGLSGPGLGLPLPQNLYPSQLGNAPSDTPTNRIALNAGDVFVIPAGEWLVSAPMYAVLQYLDPISGVWAMGATAGWAGGVQYVKSDGFNVRLANLMNCVVSAAVSTPGGGWTQSSTTIVATGGSPVSTWLPIIGGGLTFSSVVGAGGAGYGLPPIAIIAPPPPAANNSNGVGGIPASGYCTIASGTVSGFTFTNPGAGYPSIPAVVVVPSPYDPNLATGITAATLSISLAYTGRLTGALCTNAGGTLASFAQGASAPVTLTISGAGSNATLSPNVLTTCITASAAGTGTGYGTLNALVTTVGGVPITTGSLSMTPDALLLAFRPRPAQIGFSVTNAGTLGAQLGAIYDGGLFLTNTGPSPVILSMPQTTVTQAYVGSSLTLTFGPRPDVITLQPGP